jgi:hypothetical protein
VVWAVTAWSPRERRLDEMNELGPAIGPASRPASGPASGSASRQANGPTNGPASGPASGSAHQVPVFACLANSPHCPHPSSKVRILRVCQLCQALPARSSSCARLVGPRAGRRPGVRWGRRRPGHASVSAGPRRRRRRRAFPGPARGGGGGGGGVAAAAASGASVNASSPAADSIACGRGCKALSRDTKCCA